MSNRYIPAWAADRCLHRDAAGGVAVAYRSATVRQRLVCFYPACIVRQWLVLRWLTTGRRFWSSSRNEVFVGASRLLLATISSRRGRPVSPDCSYYRDDVLRSVLPWDTRYALPQLHVAAAENRAYEAPENYLQGNCARDPISCEICYVQLSRDSGEARNTPVKSRRPSAVAVIAVVCSPSSTLIRRSSQHTFDSTRLHGRSVDRLIDRLAESGRLRPAECNHVICE